MKRKYVKPMIVLCLLATLAIVGTLAYLTDVTDEFENSFTVKDKVDIELNETEKEFDLIPGTTPTKDPTITVVADASYVFTEVVEQIPTKALTAGTIDTADDNTYATFVDYDINSTCYTAAGGTIYRDTDGDGTPETTAGIDWYWAIVDVTDTADGTDNNIIVDTTGYYDTDNSQGAATTYTYVYALVGEDGNLLSVSSTDLMLNPAYISAEETPDVDQYIQAEFPILLNDQVTIPEDLSQDQLELLLTDADDDEDDTYPVLLTFTGYAIQTAGLDDLTTYEAIYDAAKGN